MNALYHAHSGLRYLVLLAAIAAVIALAYGIATGRSSRAGRVLAAAFTGLLDLQILLGVALVMGGLFPDAVAGHLVAMILAAVSAHGSSIAAKRAHDERRAMILRLSGIVLALALIVSGILVLGRSVFGSAPHSAI